jgi:hypothetical protein
MDGLEARNFKATVGLLLIFVPNDPFLNESLFRRHGHCNEHAFTFKIRLNRMVVGYCARPGTTPRADSWHRVGSEGTLQALEYYATRIRPFAALLFRHREGRLHLANRHLHVSS